MPNLTPATPLSLTEASFTFHRQPNGRVDVTQARTSEHVLTADPKRGIWEWNSNNQISKDLRSAVEEMVLSFTRRRLG